MQYKKSHAHTDRAHAHANFIPSTQRATCVLAKFRKENILIRLYACMHVCMFFARRMEFNIDSFY